MTDETKDGAEDARVESEAPPDDANGEGSEMDELAGEPRGERTGAAGGERTEEASGERTGEPVEERSDEAGEEQTGESAGGRLGARGEGGSIPSDASAVPEGGEPVTDDAETAEERIAELETELEARAERIEELESQLKRSRADFQNYKKRQKKRQEQLRRSATEELLERLLSVRDNLQRAIEQDSDDVEALREGVKITLAEFDRILDAEDVTEIAPDPGTDVDPQRHEVMLRVESDMPEGTVHEVYQPGYELDDKVLRAAQVTVSDGGGESRDADETSENGDVGGNDDASGNGYEGNRPDEAGEPSRTDRETRGTGREE